MVPDLPGRADQRKTGGPGHARAGSSTPMRRPAADAVRQRRPGLRGLVRQAQGFVKQHQPGREMLGMDIAARRHLHRIAVVMAFVKDRVLPETGDLPHAWASSRTWRAKIGQHPWRRMAACKTATTRSICSGVTGKRGESRRPDGQARPGAMRQLVIAAYGASVFTKGGIIVPATRCVSTAHHGPCREGRAAGRAAPA